jgi:hypothetical protein
VLSGTFHIGLRGNLERTNIGRFQILQPMWCCTSKFGLSNKFMVYYLVCTNELCDSRSGLIIENKKKITDFRKHHEAFILDWEDMDDNNNDNEEPHNNSDYRRYQAWYQSATRIKLRRQWIDVDYADIDSSEDEDTTYDQSTRVGTQVETAPILD